MSQLFYVSLLIFMEASVFLHKARGKNH